MATVNLGSLAVGDTVQIYEQSTAQRYIVIHKGNPDTSIYDGSCNGVWLMRYFLYGTTSMWGGSVNDYSGSSIHTWLNKTFISQFASSVQSLIRQAKIPYNYGNTLNANSVSVTGSAGLSAKVFLLSKVEVGLSTDDYGSCLDYFTVGTGTAAKEKRIASDDGNSDRVWWLRSAHTVQTTYGAYVDTVSKTGADSAATRTSYQYIRPTIILPASADVVDGVITGESAGSSGLYVGVNGVARNVTNAYVGIPSVKLTNLVPALSGTTGWGAGTGTLTAGGTAKYSANSLCLYGGSSNVEATAISTNKYSYVAGHKYYIRNEVYFTSGTTYKRTSCYWPIAEPNVWNSSSLGISFADATWKMLAVISDRVAAGHTAGADYLRFDFDNNKGGGYMHIDGIMLIDLTAAFGAGKEPSLSWCNENIPYFTGTKEIIYSGATARARKIVRGYIGVNGVARLFMDNS